MLRRLASFSRLILFDKQGSGLSDPVPRPPTHEDRAREVEAVMGFGVQNRGVTGADVVRVAGFEGLLAVP
jgi:hypothetical protein